MTTWWSPCRVPSYSFHRQSNRDGGSPREAAVSLGVALVEVCCRDVLCVPGWQLNREHKVSCPLTFGIPAHRQGPLSSKAVCLTRVVGSRGPVAGRRRKTPIISGGRLEEHKPTGDVRPPGECQFREIPLRETPETRRRSLEFRECRPEGSHSLRTVTVGRLRKRSQQRSGRICRPERDPPSWRRNSGSRWTSQNTRTGREMTFPRAA